MNLKNHSRIVRMLAGGALVLTLAGPAAAADTGASAPQTGGRQVKTEKAAPKSGPSIFDILRNMGPATSAKQRHYDVNGDGQVSFSDLLALIAKF